MNLIPRFWMSEATKRSLKLDQEIKKWRKERREKWSRHHWHNENSAGVWLRNLGDKQVTLSQDFFDAVDELIFVADFANNMVSYDGAVERQLQRLRKRLRPLKSWYPYLG